jgi:cytochrome b
MEAERVRVWDPVVRVFHWALVTAFAASWWTQEQHYDWHLVAGYTVLGLVALRLVWGFLGSRHARFADFVRGPRAVLGYLAQVARRRAPRYLGHNPAGGAMIVAVLLVMLAVTLSGIALDAAENRAGPLGDTTLFRHADAIVRVHVVATDLSLVLIALHLLGVVHTSLAHRENLVRAMITGTKRRQDAPIARGED